MTSCFQSHPFLEEHDDLNQMDELSICKAVQKHFSGGVDKCIL